MSSVIERIEDNHERGARPLPVRLVGDVRVIAPEGHVVVGNRQRVKDRVVDDLAIGRCKFVFDLSAVGYVDASGFGMFIVVAKKIREIGGASAFCDVNPDLCTMLESLRLDTLLTVQPTFDAAFALVGGVR